MMSEDEKSSLAPDPETPAPQPAEPETNNEAVAEEPAAAVPPPPEPATFTPDPAPIPTPPPAPAARPRRPWIPWVGGGCLGCLPWIILVFMAVGGLSTNMHTLSSGDKVGLIYLDGTIAAGHGGASFFGAGGSADSVVTQLSNARRESEIRAVVLRINSPGGSAAASQEIYEEVMRLRRSGKPVIVSMGDVAASGGYYVASAADKILANGSTMTGSIGVIMETENLQGLYRKIGVGFNTIKSGKFKDIGSGSRQMTVDERKLLQALVNDTYEQFVHDVCASRKQLSPAQLRRIADGRVFTGRQALKLKLVDGLGNLQDAITEAGRAAHIKGRPAVVELSKHGLLDLLSEEGDTSSSLRLPTNGEDARLGRTLRRMLMDPSLAQ